MTLVQTVNPAVSTGTITVTLAVTLPGSLILVFIGTSALTDTVSTVTDNVGNTIRRMKVGEGMSRNELAS